MGVLASYNLNNGHINFSLIDRLEFTLNDNVVNFQLNAVILDYGNFRLLEDGEILLLEDGFFRLLE